MTALFHEPQEEEKSFRRETFLRLKMNRYLAKHHKIQFRSNVKCWESFIPEFPRISWHEIGFIIIVAMEKLRWTNIRGKSWNFSFNCSYIAQANLPNSLAVRSKWTLTANQSFGSRYRMANKRLELKFTDFTNYIRNQFQKLYSNYNVHARLEHIELHSKCKISSIQP